MNAICRLLSVCIGTSIVVAVNLCRSSAAQAKAFQKIVKHRSRQQLKQSTKYVVWGNPMSTTIGIRIIAFNNMFCVFQDSNSCTATLSAIGALPTAANASHLPASAIASASVSRLSIEAASASVSRLSIEPCCHGLAVAVAMAAAVAAAAAVALAAAVAVAAAVARAGPWLRLWLRLWRWLRPWL